MMKIAAVLAVLWWWTRRTPRSGDVSTEVVWLNPATGAWEPLP